MAVIGIDTVALSKSIAELDALDGALDEKLSAFTGQSRFGAAGMTESGGPCREELALLDTMLAGNVQSFKSLTQKTRAFLASVQTEYETRDNGMARQLANGGTP